MTELILEKATNLLTPSGERLRLENPLQRWKIHNQHLSDDGQSDSHEKHSIREKPYGKDALRLRAARQSVPHVEEHEASERHRRVTSSYALRTHLERIDKNDNVTSKILSFTSFLKTHSVPAIMTRADRSTFKINFLVIIGSLVFRGFCLTTSFSTGSTPKLCAGGPSIMMLIHKIYRKQS